MHLLVVNLIHLDRDVYKRQAFAHNTEMKARLDKMQQEMADRTDYESESYAQLVEKFTLEHERYMALSIQKSLKQLVSRQMRKDA